MGRTGTGRTGTGRAAAVYGVLQLAAVALALWLSWRFEVASMATTAIALAPTMPAAFLAWLAYRDDRREAADPAAKAALLASAVKVTEARQRAQLIGEGAHRIDLTFRYRVEPANNAAGAATSGRLAHITEYYRSLRPARLVITGEPGAGKTLLALELILGLLTDSDRADSDPVPVRFSMAEWDTEQPLDHWLADRIHEQFRSRGVTAADAAALVEQHRILPVLDGLDEMDSDTTALANRRAVQALRQLNAYQDAAGSAPVVLTCRTGQYAELAAKNLRVREAAHVGVDPVTPAQAEAYLVARSADPARWHSLTTALHADPGGAVALGLSTPWRLNLAATVYEEQDPATLDYVRDPAELHALGSSEALRDHLLGLYLSAAIRRHPVRPGRYDHGRTHRWLAGLAGHLRSGHFAAGGPTGPGTSGASAASGAGTDLVLHELWPMAGPRRVRVVDAVLAGILTGTCSAVSVILTGDYFIGWLGLLLLIVVMSVWSASRAVLPNPKYLHLHWLRDTKRVVEVAWAGLVVGLWFVLMIGYFVVDAAGVGIELGAALAAGLMSGIAATLGFGLITPQEDPLSADPRRLVRDDLAAALVTVVVLAMVVGLGIGIPIGILDEPGAGLASALTVCKHLTLTLGIPFGLYLVCGGGRRYLVFLCCIRGRLPWRVGAFLHWAYGAGLLRIGGVAYQFRHRELQDWLADHPHP